MTDPYVYPGTSVLRNKFGIRNTDQLAVVERRFTRARAREPLEPPITPEGYRALHGHLFQDVYQWAGEYRTCQLGRTLWFEEPRNIEHRMNVQFERIAADQYLLGRNIETFCQRLAEHLCELNDIHPFREGNGRVNRLFAKQLASQAGHKLNGLRLGRAEWLEASIAGFHSTDYGPMEKLLLATMDTD